MYPSKAIFNQLLKINSPDFYSLVEECFTEIYNPRMNLGELLAELEAALQGKINKNPKEILNLETPYGLIPEKIVLTFNNRDSVYLASLVESKGTNLSFFIEIDYREVQLVGFFDEKYMITPVSNNIWQDYAEIIYIPKKSGLKIKKLQMLE